MNTSSPRPTFALVGAAGYVARRHLEAIKAVGGTLLACHDISDSVGVLDSYFPHAEFFVYGREFDEYLSYETPDYLVVCTPNDLHEVHAALGVRLGAGVIVEKPPALSTEGIDYLIALERESGSVIHPVLQMRYHPAVLRFRELMAARDPARPLSLTVEYVTYRGPWFGASWKGDQRRSGGIVYNIGIHLLDVLSWALGPGPEVVRAATGHGGTMADGVLRFGRTTVEWVLSTRYRDMPGREAMASRRIWADGEPVCDFSDHAGLHTVMYREIIAGRGHRITDAREAVSLAGRINRAAGQPGFTALPAGAARPAMQ